MLISEMLEWLQPVEQEAAVAYREAAECFAAQPALTAFLTRLADDEDAHCNLLKQAHHRLVTTHDDGIASILADDAMRQRVTAPLRDLHARAQERTLTETDALAVIVQAEFSEWNEIFLYVLARFRQQGPSFHRVAAMIEQHRHRIEAYLASLPESQRPPAATATPPRVWNRRILVADDEPGLRLALKLFLKRFGEVTTAVNGREALDQATQQYFDVIVSDVDMPMMNGLEFYRALVTGDSPGQNRFVFVTADAPVELQQLCAQGKVRMLSKPFALEALHQAVSAVLDQPE